MVTHRHSQSGIFRKLFTLVLICSMGVLLICASAGAAEDASKMKPGDCTSCHAGKQVLPGNHPDTKGMTIKGCLMCHGKDKVPLSDKFMSTHEQILSGGSSSSKAPDASGKVGTFAASVSLQKAQ